MICNRVEKPEVVLSFVLLLSRHEPAWFYGAEHIINDGYTG